MKNSLGFRVSKLSRKRANSFTLVELLTVIFIIAILAALTLIAGEGVMKAAARSRAKSEIQAISTALENYKADNGIYPLRNPFNATAFGTTNQYASTDGSAAGGLYQVSSQILYEALSGKINFTDIPVADTKSYMAFKANQLGNAASPPGYSATGSTYIRDPFGYSYGYQYSNNPETPPMNGTGFFDLWSTGGVLAGSLAANPTLTNSWISNWPQ